MIFKKNKLLRNFIYIKLKLLFIKKNNWKKFKNHNLKNKNMCLMNSK